MLNVSIVAGTSAVNTVAEPNVGYVIVAGCGATATSGPNSAHDAATAKNGAPSTNPRLRSGAAAVPPASLTVAAAATAMRTLARPKSYARLNSNSSCDGFEAISSGVPSSYCGYPGTACYGTRGSRTSGCHLWG